MCRLRHHLLLAATDGTGRNVSCSGIGVRTGAVSARSSIEALDEITRPGLTRHGALVQGRFSLSQRVPGRVKHFMIAKDERGKWKVLGKMAAFDDIPGLIRHHETSPISTSARLLFRRGWIASHLLLYFGLATGRASPVVDEAPISRSLLPPTAQRVLVAPVLTATWSGSGSSPGG